MKEILHVQNKIYEIRNQRVMLDYDLAEMYGVETKRLKEQVRRNIERFPEDFMFELTKEEYNSLRSQIATLENGRGKYSKYSNFAFTEHGVAMLSTVLRSAVAIQTNINIIRAFTYMRQYLSNNSSKKELEALNERVKYLEDDISEDREAYEKQFDELFNAFAQLNLKIQSKNSQLERVKIEGFVPKKK